MDKPPIGASPHWFYTQKRMKELNEAIGRHLDFAYEQRALSKQAPRYELIAEWSEELKTLALLEARLE